MLPCLMYFNTILNCCKEKKTFTSDEMVLKANIQKLPITKMQGYIINDNHRIIIIKFSNVPLIIVPVVIT